jgi:hypothetical protein
MKKTILLLSALFITLSSWAYDFTTGGIYYNITSSVSPYTVAVTYATSSYNSYSGDVTIPSSVTYNSISYSVTSIYGGGAINGSAFYGCTGLTSITIPSSVTSIGSYAFYGCTSLNLISIPTSVTSIGAYAFVKCSGLNAINIPSSVTSFNDGLFSQCSSLTTISIPTSVTSIGNYVFADCSGLTSIYANKITPVDLSYSSAVFYNISTKKCILHVPFNSASAYDAASQWTDFTNIVADIVTSSINTKASNLKVTTNNGKVVISGLPQAETLEVYNLQGIAIYNQKITAETESVNLPTHGVYVVKVGNESVKVVY